jgi:prepilin-type N-terminal cleavage/methylation domain-containing protein
MKMRRNLAFTLAEVLITLGIIGVVASMTIPTLMNNIADAQYKTAYKKAFSIASQAVLTNYNDDSLLSRSSWYDEAANRANFNAFRDQFKVAKSCDTDISQCWEMTGEKAYGIPSSADTPGFIDTSGYAWIATSEMGGFTGGIALDTNGFKKPNQYGKDRFLFNNHPFDKSCADNIDIGLPGRICPWNNDYIAPTGTNGVGGACPSGKCYYASWLYN